MTIHAAVTEALNGTALLAECRRCLAVGVDLKATYIKQVVDLIEECAITNITGWTQAVDNALDGRNAVEAAVIA